MTLHDIRAIAPARTVLDWILRMGGPHVNAERTALRVLRSLPSDAGEAPEAALLRRTRAAIRQERRRSWLPALLGRTPALPCPDPETDPRMDREWWRRRLQHVFEPLSPTRRAVLVLVDLEGRTVPQVAALLGLSSGRVTDLLFEARESLARGLSRCAPLLQRAALAQPSKPRMDLPSAQPSADEIRRALTSTSEEVDHLVEALSTEAPSPSRPAGPMAAALVVTVTALLWVFL